MLTVKRTSIARRDAEQPGYAAALETVASGGDETHLRVERDAFQAVQAQFPLPRSARQRHKRFALGDAVERVLTTVGITKELVQKITRKPCKCPARQQWLNQWGYRQQERIEKAVTTAAKWYGIT